jgi:hypothetical protein
MLATPSTADSFISSSEAATDEEIAHPIDQDRVKTATQKQKGKEVLSS